ncbi:MAG: hypothetical protein GDA53_01790 [Rhodobacteraceae bacterium]|nr:hypothetical protein [Paracoccaceae bacterium]
MQDINLWSRLIDQAFLYAIWHLFLVNLFPLLCFFIGVYISQKLNLNGNLPAKETYLMAIPVSLLSVGAMVLGTRYNVSPIEFLTPKLAGKLGSISVAEMKEQLVTVRYTHMRSFEYYGIFCGMIILHGTLVPQLFRLFRETLVNNNT